MNRIPAAEFSAATERVRTWKRPLLVSHVKPDGDALGSLAACRRMLDALGISATALIFEEVPTRLSMLTRSHPFAILGEDLSRAELNRFDGVVVLDTCTYSQLEPVADFLRSSPAPKLAIDHHRTRDDVADAYLIDESAAANCLVLYDWAQSAGWTLDRETADALFVGITTDTGWFRHSNTDHRTFAAAADLVSRGVEAHAVFEALYMFDKEGRIRLLAAALQSLELHADGKLALMTLPAAAFTQAGATYSDTEDIINEPLRIATVVASVLLVEQDGGIVRASFRSRVAGDGGHDLDVSAIAKTFGGGGHERAAGAKMPGPIATARKRILESIAPLLAAR